MEESNEIFNDKETVTSTDEKVGVLGKVKKIFTKKEEAFTAERAWLESTYGVGVHQSVDKRIANKQTDIMNTIKSKFRYVGTDGGVRVSYSSYHCVIDIEEDLAAHTDVIFKPFIDNGFRIINLSDQVKEITEDNVYLVSWKNAFESTTHN